MPCCGELGLDHEENAETGKRQAAETDDRNVTQRSRVSLGSAQPCFADQGRILRSIHQGQERANHAMQALVQIDRPTRLNRFVGRELRDIGPAAKDESVHMNVYLCGRWRNAEHGNDANDR